MRIRGVKQSSSVDCLAVSRSTSSSWSSSSSSPSSSSSSVTATHSLASSQDSSNSSSSSLITASSRCPGLDLLVKAIHQITAGSVVGVPYIQRRVTIRRRRRRMSGLDGFIYTGIVGEKGLQNEKKAWTSAKKTSEKMIGRRTVYQMGFSHPDRKILAPSKDFLTRLYEHILLLKILCFCFLIWPHYYMLLFFDYYILKLDSLEVS